MQRLYLLRHAAPALPAGSSFCLGQRSDPPLSAEGRAKAAALSHWFSGREIRALGASPLLRCQQTVQLLFPGVQFRVLPGMAELDCGAWDGLSFEEIRAKYPEQYTRRGEDPSLPPPGGESLPAAAARGIAALRDFLSQAEGDALVVAHAGINRALLCALLNKPFREVHSLPQGYLSLNLMQFDGAEFCVEAVGLDRFNLSEGSVFREKTL